MATYSKPLNRALCVATMRALHNRPAYRALPRAMRRKVYLTALPRAAQLNPTRAASIACTLHKVC